jgi:NAD(P)H-dependent flavin oxidoreductase YrpB (nitropropane dioxygenase family)
MTAPRVFAAELGRARRLAAGRPVAANLLVPFVRQAHIAACIAADVALVVFHGGLGVRWFRALAGAGIPIFCTVGTVSQARHALGAAVGGLVVQGAEAGGHLMGDEPLASLLPQVRELAGDDVPILAAGGVADAADVRRLLDAGATAAVAGTRFLLTEECGAHPGYQRRVLDASRTLRTMLFGIGWPLPHRVVPNAATDRWCASSELGPRAARTAARASAPLGRVLPMTALSTMVAMQRPGIPLFSPALPLRGMPEQSVDRCALYAGETMHRISDVVPAAEAVARLTP